MNLSARSHPAQPGPEPAAAAPVAALLRSAKRDIVAVGALGLVPALALTLAAGLGAAHALVALAWFAAGGGLVWHTLHAGGHPHAAFGGANRVTTLRMALVGLLAGLPAVAAWAPPLSGPGTAPLAWGVVVLATCTALLDACDGPLARRSGLASRWGARFDMETDAAFILVLSGLVWQAGQAGAWVLAAGLMRYAFVAAARLRPWLAAPLAPSRRRQAVCVLQVTVLIVCLGPIVSSGLASALAAASLLMLGASFAIDIRTLARARHAQTEH